MDAPEKLEITGIQRTKRGRFSVYLDGEFYCALHVDVFAGSSISSGGFITLEEMEELRNASEQKITRERALRLLGQRSYTEKGLYDKLRERTDERNAAEAVARMAELGLVDDRDYARRYGADCLRLKGFSRGRTAQELARKGIDREIVDETLEELFAEENPEPRIADVVRRKYMRYLREPENEKGISRTVNALSRLGYRFEDIRTVLSNLAEDEDYYEE